MTHSQDVIGMLKHLQFRSSSAFAMTEPEGTYS